MAQTYCARFTLPFLLYKARGCNTALLSKHEFMQCQCSCISQCVHAVTRMCPPINCWLIDAEPLDLCLGMHAAMCSFCHLLIIVTKNDACMQRSVNVQPLIQPFACQLLHGGGTPFCVRSGVCLCIIHGAWHVCSYRVTELVAACQMLLSLVFGLYAMRICCTSLLAPAGVHQSAPAGACIVRVCAASPCDMLLGRMLAVAMHNHHTYTDHIPYVLLLHATVWTHLDDDAQDCLCAG